MVIGSRRWLAASVFGLVLIGPVAAQEFPSRTVKIVMGFGPGGLGDIAGAPSAR
jgi:tripartite-type tricarboxylate transporter receptor subunit TctC